MLDRLASIGVDSGLFLRAEGESLLAQARRSAFWGGVFLFGSAVVGVSIVGLLVAGAALAARHLGWIAALAIASAIFALVGIAVIVAARRALHHVVHEHAGATEARERSRDARRALEEDVEEEPDVSWQDRIVDYMARNPGKVAGGALCAVAIIGPFRSMKMASRAMMLAGLVSSVREQMGTPEKDRSTDTGTAREATA